MLQSIPAGFARPVFESQGTFRAILDAMSRPGRVVPLPVQAEGPQSWSGGMASVVLTLCDMDTPVWLDAQAATDDARRFLRFHCACPLIDTPAQASFAVVMNHALMPSLDAFALGSAEYPEQSTTVLLATDLDAATGESISVSVAVAAGATNCSYFKVTTTRPSSLRATQRTPARSEPSLVRATKLHG